MNNMPTDSDSTLDEIEELIDWNLQYNIQLGDTLAAIRGSLPATRSTLGHIEVKSRSFCYV